MLDGLLSSIRQIGVFMICAQALIHFKPKSSYEKYLKLLVSAMILVQLLSPIAALLIGEEGQGLEERIAAYGASFEQGLGEAALEEYRIEQLRRQLLATQLEQLDIGVPETGDPAEQADERGEYGEQEQAEETAEDREQEQAEEIGEDREREQPEEIRIRIDPVDITVP